MRVHVADLTFAYDASRPVLNGLSFDLQSGSTLAVLGGSGSGKSTLLRIIAGLLPRLGRERMNGHVLLDDVEPQRIRRDIGQIGFMFQEPSLLPFLNLYENVVFPLNALAKPVVKEKVEDFISELGLLEFMDFLPKSLSGGMQARVALARTLVAEPSLLLLDEPFSSLDFGWRMNLYTIYKRLRDDRHFTSLLVTHDITEAVLLADEILVLGSDGSTLKREQIPNPKPLSYSPIHVVPYLELLRPVILGLQTTILQSGGLKTVC